MTSGKVRSVGILAVVLLALAVAGSWLVLREPPRSEPPGASVAKVPAVENVPGGEQTDFYDRLRREENRARAASAENSQRSAVPTMGPLQPASEPEPPKPPAYRPPPPRPPARAERPAPNPFNDAMNKQMAKLLAAWTPGPHAGSGSLLAVNASASATAEAPPENSLSKPRPVIQAGEIHYGVMVTEINTDDPVSQPVADIIAGRLKGSRLLGSVKTGSVVNGTVYAQRVGIQFSQITLPDGRTLPAQAYAIDPDTSRTAVASAVDNHYLSRYGFLAAATFLEGVGIAKLAAGSRVFREDDFAVIERRNLDTQDLALIAAGKVGEAFARELSRNFNRPPTITVSAGEPVGILFIADVSEAGEAPVASASISPPSSTAVNPLNGYPLDADAQQPLPYNSRPEDSPYEEERFRPR